MENTRNDKGMNKPLVIGILVVMALVILIGAIALNLNGTALIALTSAVAVSLGLTIVRVMTGKKM